MAGRGIYRTDGTPYLVSYWCSSFYSRCKVCKQNKNTIIYVYKIINLNSKLSFVPDNIMGEREAGCVMSGRCLSCFENIKFTCPTEEELQQQIFKLRKKIAKQELNKYLIKDLTDIILSLVTIYSDDNN